MGDAIPQDVKSLRYMDVDLITHLGALAEKVCKKYPQDWLLDAKLLALSSLSENPEEKNLVWFAYRYGSIIKTEHEVFIKDSRAFNFITDYIQQKQQTDFDMFGYIVEVTEYDGKILKGNIFEIDSCVEYTEHIRNMALPLDSVTITYLADEPGKNKGKEISVSRNEFVNQYDGLMNNEGKVIDIKYNLSESVSEMTDLLRQEHAKRMLLPIGSTGEFLRNMKVKLTTVKPKTLADKFRLAYKKVKAQDAQNNNKKSPKREERS